MARAKRPLEDADPNVESSPNKFSKGNDSRRRSLRSSGRMAEKENATPAKAKSTVAKTKAPNSKSAGSRPAKKGTSNSKTTSPKQRSDDNDKNKDLSTGRDTSTRKDGESKDEAGQSRSKSKKGKGENLAVLPSYEYIVGQPPVWDWRDQYIGQSEKKTSEAYSKMMEQLQPYLFKPIEQKPDHKWVLMRHAMLRSVDGIWDSNRRNPDLFDMHIYEDYQGYGQHEVVENFIVDYRNEYIKEDKDRNLNEMWALVTGLIHYLKTHEAISDRFGHIDDGDRVVGILGLIGTTFLSMLNILDRTKQLKPDSDSKDLALVMKLYIIWGEEWDSMTYDNTTQNWNLKIYKYAKNHKISLKGNPPKQASSAAKEVEKRLGNQQPWPKEGPDRWDFEDSFDKHRNGYGTEGPDGSIQLGGNKYEITNMTRAERKRYSFDGKDPLADISAKDLREKELLIGYLE